MSAEPTITTPQRNKLMIELWPKAAKALGVKVSDRAQRMAVLSEAVGRPLESANDIGAHDEFSRVVDHLGKLAGDLPAAMRDGQQTRTERDRLLYVIGEQKKQLALYLSPTSDAGVKCSVNAYIESVIRDKFNRGRRTERRQIEDLSNEAGMPKVIRGHLIEPPSELKQLMMTLSGRINDFRKEAGHSLHEMNTKAGTKCRDNCRKCAEGVLPAGKPVETVDESEPVGAELVVAEGNPF